MSEITIHDVDALALTLLVDFAYTGELVVCRVSFKHFPQPLRSHIQRFGTLGQLLNIPPLSTQNLHGRGGRGGPRICCC